MDGVAIRLPLPLRVYVAGFGLVWCGGLAAALLTKQPAGAPIPLFMLVAGGTFTVRLFRMAVLADRDALVVRNMFRTRRIPREDVEDFRVGSVQNALFGKTIHVLLRDRSVLPLDATARPALLRAGRRRLEEHLSALTRWQAGSEGPRS